MRARRATLLLGLAGLLPAGPGLAAPPQRVVSLDLCSDWILTVHAAPGQIAALSPMGRRFGARYGPVGGWPEHDGSLEQVIALRPDRVIVGSETYPARIATNWPMVEEHPHVIGDFTWTGWDYLGEVGIGRPKFLGQPFEARLIHPRRIGLYAATGRNGAAQSFARRQVELRGVQGTHHGCAPHQAVGQRTGAMRTVCLYREHSARAGIEHRDPFAAYGKSASFIQRNGAHGSHDMFQLLLRPHCSTGSREANWFAVAGA